VSSAAVPATRPGKVWVIVNPVAGGHRATQAWERLRTQVEQAVGECAVHFTVAPGHATDIAHSAVAAGVDRLLIFGGDGTIQEAVAALRQSAVILGVVPAGTGNDFSRTHGIPRDIGPALEIALTGTARAIDLGVVNGRTYINVAGVGFDAEVAAWAKYRSRRFSGPAVYLAGVLTQLWAYRPQLLTYSVDGAPARTEECLLIAVGNGRYYGGGMMICPEADATDGLLDVIVGGNLGRLETLRLLPKVFSGRHLGQPKVSMLRGRRVEIQGPATLTVHADGEPVGRLPAVFELAPASLWVAMPPTGPI